MDAAAEINCATETNNAISDFNSVNKVVQNNNSLEQNKNLLDEIYRKLQEALHSFEASLPENIFKVSSSEEATERALKAEKDLISEQKHTVTEELSVCKAHIETKKQ